MIGIIRLTSLVFVLPYGCSSAPGVNRERAKAHGWCKQGQANPEH